MELARRCSKTLGNAKSLWVETRYFGEHKTMRWQHDARTNVKVLEAEPEWNGLSAELAIERDGKRAGLAALLGRGHHAS